MKFNISLEKEKLSESQIREKIQRAAKYTRESSELGGKQLTQESVEREMVRNAERDTKDGKI